MNGIGRIILAEDGTDATQSARSAALGLARLWKLPLHVVTSGAAAARAETVHTEFAHECNLARVIVSFEVLDGDPVEGVTACATRSSASLLITGSRPHARQSGQRSVSQALVAASAVPVLVVRSGNWPPDQIVIGDDGSLESRTASELAAEMGSVFGASAVLIDALPQIVSHGRGPLRSPMRQRAREEEADRISRDAVHVSRWLHGPAVAVLSPDAPAVAIGQHARDAAWAGHVLIAVGSSGRTELERLLGWSVSARVAELESASVLVVPRTWAVERQRTSESFAP